MQTHKRHLRMTVTVMAVIGLLAVAAIGYVVWFAYHSAHVADASLRSANHVSKDIPKLPQITTFAACQQAAGSKMLQTYPEQCVTTAGKTFTNTQKYLVIKEWGVQIPYAGNDTFTYQVKIASSGNGVQASSEQLASKYKCVGYGAGSIARLHGSDLADPAGDTAVQLLGLHPDMVTKLGNYYYVFVHDQAECNDAAASYQTAANDTIKASLANIEPIK